MSEQHMCEGQFTCDYLTTYEAQLHIKSSLFLSI